jgi:hypothetical protein
MEERIENNPYQSVTNSRKPMNNLPSTNIQQFYRHAVNSINAHGPTGTGQQQPKGIE